MKERRRRALGLSIAAAFVLGLSVSAGIPQAQNRAPRRIPLPELEEPGQVCVENGKVFIADKRDVLVYDFKDGRLLGRIGKMGRGPGEFMMGPLRLTVLADKLFVGDFRKLVIFTLEGKYISDIREPGFMGAYPFLPVGGNYVGFPMEIRSDGSSGPPSGRIYDKDLKVKTKFFGEFDASPPPPPPPGSPPPATKTDTLLVREYGDCIVYGDRIYVADSRKGLSISVFSSGGDFLYEIRQPVEKLRIAKNFAGDEIKEKERQAGKYWPRISSSQNFVAPEYFPAFVGFKIDGGRIYVITPAQKNGLYEVIEMDLEGKVLEKAFRFPIKPVFAALELFGRRYDVEDDMFVWFAYNDAREMFELNVR